MLSCIIYGKFYEEWFYIFQFIFNKKKSMGFFDFLAAPFHAVEHVVDSVIGLPKSIVHDLSSAGASVVHDATGVSKAIVHEASTLGSSVAHEAGGALTGVAKSADHALQGVSKNLILPLSIGAGALAFYMVTQNKK